MSKVKKPRSGSPTWPRSKPISSQFKFSRHSRGPARPFGKLQNKGSKLQTAIRKKTGEATMDEIERNEIEHAQFEMIASVGRDRLREGRASDGGRKLVDPGRAA